MAPLLLTFAIHEEKIVFPDLAVPVCTVITGMGKSNAAMVTTEAILQYRPFAVINIGTAGTFRHHIGDVIVCRRFIDRDLMPLQLAGLTAELHTPHDLFTGLPSLLKGETVPIPDFAVSTGDNFVTDGMCQDADVVDMEAFAEAQVCQHFKKPFLAVKCVTDVVGKNSLETWSHRLQEANETLTSYFRQFCGRISESQNIE